MTGVWLSYDGSGQETRKDSSCVLHFDGDLFVLLFVRDCLLGMGIFGLNLGNKNSSLKFN